MTAALTSWALSIPYFLSGIGFLLIAWAAGGWLYAAYSWGTLRIAGRSDELPGSGLFNLLLRIAAGFALLSWVASIFGVAGYFRPILVLPALLFLVVSGPYVAGRFAPLHRWQVLSDRLELRHLWHSSPLLEKGLAAAVMLGFCTILVNAFVGSMVPDMNHDPMWYHLSVPRQWVFSGKFDAYPDVLQSAFPLAVEALYAIIFLGGGGPVFCSLLVPLSGFLLFSIMATAAWACLASEPATTARGWGMLAVIAVFTPLMSAYGFIAPIQPKNDITTLLWAAAGGLAIWVPLLGDRKIPSIGHWIVGGFLLGTACSAKPPVLAVAFFVMVFSVPLAVVFNWRQLGMSYRALVGRALLCLAMMGIAAAPWMVRGYLSHGVPLYPVGKSLFPVQPDFAALDRDYSTIQQVPGLQVGEWVSKVAAFPGRLYFGALHGEKMMFIYLASALAGVVLARGRWRWFAIMLTAQVIFVVGFTGAVEVFRLFSPAYTLAAPMFAWLVGTYAVRVSRQLRILAGVILTVAPFLAGFVVWQARAASYDTYQWEFRPMLSREDVRQFATHGEKGLYLSFDALQPFIDKNDRVLLLGYTYPFYLNRDTLWNDEAVGKGGLADRWAQMAPDEAYQLLRDEKIDAVLVLSGGSGDTKVGKPAAELEKLGLLEHVPLSVNLTEEGWKLYRVIPANVP